jgi:hypothetical protein
MVNVSNTAQQQALDQAAVISTQIVVKFVFMLTISWWSIMKRCTPCVLKVDDNIGEFTSVKDRPSDGHEQQQNHHQRRAQCF